MSPSHNKPLVLANWKMNLSVRQSVDLARRVTRSLSRTTKIDLVLCPTFPALPGVAEVVKRKSIALGAQDVFWKAAGPYTGEVSPAVLRELGVKYVIVGHSERRQYLKETDIVVQQKTLAALAQGLIPVLCVGETFAERQAGQKDVVIMRQVTAALKGVTLPSGLGLVVAYEPVWVIGSGQAVEPREALHTAQVIRQVLIDIFPPSVIERQVRLIYGGSVDTTNIAAFVRQPPLSGVLVGGASLSAKQFIDLVRQL
ncbi:MAG: triose-phosphate isomerase [Candidatus Kerfeldbacteria bacterium]|nr:triose-phosphate isomerase [Candidatus Kerfeldbacteria bacterium]